MTTPSRGRFVLRSISFLFTSFHNAAGAYYSLFPLSDQCILHANDRDSGPESVLLLMRM